MYAKIIMFANQKGGKGKTLHSHLFALNLSSKKHKKKVLILELDPQQTLTKAVELLKVTPVYDLKTEHFDNIKRALEENLEKYDYILIDIAGMLELSGIRTAISYSHTVFIPLKPSLYNTVSTYEFIEECIELKEERKNTEYPFQYFVFMNGNNQTNRAIAKREKKKIEDSGVPILTNELPERKRYLDETYNFDKAIVDIENPTAYEYDYVRLFNEMLSKIESNNS